jgi:hypothetical protein
LTGITSAEAMVELAARALDDMYRSYEEDGGVSPDTYDEHLAVADTLGAPPFDRDNELERLLLDAIYDQAQGGIAIDEIARLHVEALGDWLDYDAS